MIVMIKHIEIEGPGTLEEFFKEAGRDTKIIELANGETLPTVEECEAVVSLGGPMNVYETDKYPFLSIEEDFLKEALEKEVPILGICLGAQLLAKICGAEVKKAEQEEIGWYGVDLTEEGMKDSLFKDLNRRLEVFQWHEDTFDIPKDGVLLATSSVCKNQAMRIGRCAWGIQFHLELTVDLLESWLNYYPVDLDKEKILLEFFRKKEAYQKQAKQVFINFSRAK